MNKKAKRINPEEWEMFGGGYTADSYFHVSEEKWILKLYAEFMNPEMPLRELEVAEKLIYSGIKVPQPVAYVTDGLRYGGVFERIMDKKSFSRLLSESPEKLDEVAKKFADLTLMLHDVDCPETAFPSIAEKCKRDVMRAKCVDKYQKEALLQFIDDTPIVRKCLHGDLNLGNVIFADGVDPMFIDLGDFGWGNPLFDLSMFYFTAFYTNEELQQHLYHLSTEMMQKVWNAFAKYYFAGKDIAAEEAKIKDYCVFNAIHYANLSGWNKNLQAVVDEFFQRHPVEYPQEETDAE